jgi:chemotaxis protein histidine kinase CheA
MTRKRSGLGDLLREEVSKASQDLPSAANGNGDSNGKPTTPQKATTQKAASPAAVTAKAEIPKTETTKATSKATTPKATPASATKEAATKEAPTVDASSPQSTPLIPVPPVTEPSPELLAQIVALQAQLASQQEQLQKLNQAQEHSRQLESELATAKQTILKLSSDNLAAAKQKAANPTPTTSEPITSAPIAPAPTAKSIAHPPTVKTAPPPLAPIQPPPQAPAEQAARPYRFERIGWKPLANYLIQPEPHSTKLSDAEMGWVD